MKKLAIVALLLIGCDVPGRGLPGRDGAAGAVGDRGPVGAAGAPAAASGARLRAVWLVGDDGSRAFSGWYDSTTGQPCTYRMLDASRCVPAALPNAEELFTDPACSSPIVALHDASPTPPPCPAYLGAQTVYLHAGALVGPPPAAYYHAGGICEQATPGQLDGIYFFEGLAELQPTFFVSASLEIDP